MPNQIQLFTNPKFGQIRTITLDSEPFIAGADLAKMLGYTDTDQAIRKHCKHAKLLKPVELTGLGITECGPRGMVFIPEGDVYCLVTQSKLPQAQEAAFNH